MERRRCSQSLMGSWGRGTGPVHRDLRPTRSSTSGAFTSQKPAHSEASPAQLSLQKASMILSALLGAPADKNLCVVHASSQRSAASRGGDDELGCSEKLPQRYIFWCFAAADNYVCRAVIPELVERDETAASLFFFFLKSCVLKMGLMQLHEPNADKFFFNFSSSHQ